MSSDLDLRALLDDTDRVVVFGDVHGDTTAFRVLAERTAQMGLTRVLVSVGDFGIGPWGHETQDRILRRADDLLEQLDAVLLLTPGNHDNWDTIDAAVSDRRDELGFGVLGRHGRVRVSPRGHRFEVGGVRFGSLGGAVSVDQVSRQARHGPNASGWWWPQEEPTAVDIDALGDEPLDVLVTHDVPAEVPLVGRDTWERWLIDKSNQVRVLLRIAVDRTRPAVVFSGHWHRRVTHEIERADGGTSRVEVLSDEHTLGNAVVLDLVDVTRPVRPLPDAWREHLDTGGATPGTLEPPPAAPAPRRMHLALVEADDTLDAESIADLAAVLGPDQRILDADGATPRGAIVRADWVGGLVVRPVQWDGDMIGRPVLQPVHTWQLRARHGRADTEPVLSPDAASRAIWEWIGDGRMTSWRLVRDGMDS